MIKKILVTLVAIVILGVTAFGETTNTVKAEVFGKPVVSTSNAEKKDGLTAFERIMKATDAAEKSAGYRMSITQDQTQYTNTNGVRNTIVTKAKISSLVNSGTENHTITQMDTSVYDGDSVKVSSINQTSELYITKNKVYTKISDPDTGTDLWLANEPVNDLLGSMMNNLGTSDALSSSQAKLYKDYYSYKDNVTRNNKNYYVVSLDIGEEVFSELIAMIFKDLNISSMVPDDLSSSEKAAFDSMMNEIISSLKMKMSADYFIDAETGLIAWAESSSKFKMNAEFFGASTSSEGMLSMSMRYSDYGVKNPMPKVE